MGNLFQYIPYGNINGVYKLSAFSASDSRGGMMKLYSEKQLRNNEVDFVPKEVMYIHSNKNVLRGLHFQREKMQPKLIGCICGTIWGAIVDLRINSETFGKWVSFEISSKDENATEILVPNGCALGTLAMEDSVISCICGENYYQEYDDGILWNDKEIGIDWPLEKLENDIRVSDKDKSLKTFEEYKCCMMRN